MDTKAAAREKEWQDERADERARYHKDNEDARSRHRIEVLET